MSFYLDYFVEVHIVENCIIDNFVVHHFNGNLLGPIYSCLS